MLLWTASTHVINSVREGPATTTTPIMTGGDSQVTVLMRMLMARGSAEKGRVTVGTVFAVPSPDYRLERWRSEISGELFTGKGNRQKPGLSAGTGPSDLGGLYAPKRGTLR